VSHPGDLLGVEQQILSLRREWLTQARPVHVKRESSSRRGVGCV